MKSPRVLKTGSVTLAYPNKWQAKSLRVFVISIVRPTAFGHKHVPHLK